MSEPSPSELIPAELLEKIKDPVWRMSNLYKIITKNEDSDEEGMVVTFRPNRAQRRLIARLHHRNIILKARQMGFCVSPDTRVLTADLRWVRIGDIQPGTDVIACDEHPPGGKGPSRKMRTATVQAVKVMQAERFKITFDDGREVVCTDRHPWLSKKAGDSAQWRSLSGQGNQVVGRLKVGTKVRWIAKPWGDSTVEDGWFGGMLDGEGSISKSNSSAGINVTQREGPVWDRLVRYASDNDYNACIEADQAERPSKHGKTSVPKLAFGRMDEMFRLIGKTRPTRFIGNRFWDGRELPGKRNGDVGWSTITKIEALGVGDVVDMQTTIGTYIAEGFVSHNTTLIALLWLDTALFSKSPIRCGIIAQDRETAESIFKGKIRYAYDNLPEVLRQMFPLKTENASELEFSHNNATIRVATSMRGGTTHRLHVSEFGKICAKTPDKAKEVITGSIPSVPKSGILVIESTAEGQEGPFYEMTERAAAQQEQGTALTPKDYRFHFFAWWEMPEYELDADAVIVTDTMHRYFNDVEARIGRDIAPEKRAWYCATMEADFSGDQSLMWQEYPSYREEAFQLSTQGCYYTNQLSLARKSGRVLTTIPRVMAPVNTFWDIGKGDMTSIWLHQRVGMENRFIGYYEESGEDLDHFSNYLQGLGFVFGTHYLPHEAAHKRIAENKAASRSIQDMMEGLMPGQRFHVVPVTPSITAGIQSVRNVFGSCYFDETACMQGLKRLATYKKEWDKRNGCFKTTPVHDDASHGSDAFRQFGQEADGGNQFHNGFTTPSMGGPSGQRFRRRGSGMAV